MPCLRMKKLFLILFLIIIKNLASAQQPVDRTQLEKLKARLPAAVHDTSRMMVYNDIAMYYKDVLYQMDSALLYGQKAEAIVQKYPDYWNRSRVCINIGTIYYRMSVSIDHNTDKIKKKYYENQAEKFFQQAIADGTLVGNAKHVNIAQYDLCILWFDSGDIYSFSKNSILLASKIENKPNLQKIDSIILQGIYMRLCVYLDFEIGSNLHRSYFNEAKKITIKGVNYDKICLIEFEQKANSFLKTDEAQLIKAYRDLRDSLSENYMKIELDIYFAEYYFKIQEYQKSFDLCSKIKPSDSPESAENEAFVKINEALKYSLIGRNAFMLNRTAESITYLNNSLNYIRKIESSLENEKYLVLLYLSKAYQEAGKSKEAYDYLSQSNEIYKQLNDRQNQRLMAEYDVELEQIKQDKKLYEAQTDILLKQKEIRTTERQKNVFIIISMVAIALMLWSINNFLKKRRLSEGLTKKNLIIKQQAQLLEESNGLKDRIFALLSHDLRAPVNRLLMSVQQSNTEDLISNIEPALKGVQDTLNNVLYWSHMQLKGVNLVFTKVPLNQLVDSILREYRHDLEFKNIKCLNVIDKQFEITTDENCLKVVIRNLINNSIKFTHPQGYIYINCAINKHLVEIEIKDTGIGIPNEKLEKIFQLPQPSLGTNREKGMGIGLSLSLEIVRKLQGDIKVKSEVGKGTSMLLSLPV